MGDTVRDDAEAVATGGGVTVDGLASELEKHPATIYRAIEDFGDVLDLDQGDVSFRVGSTVTNTSDVDRSDDIETAIAIDRARTVIATAAS